MSRQIEQALFSLMPTYGTDLPPSLADMAGSLLAQSRHRASTLKPDEEVARLYACAHLACDRLKISLDLPPITPRPPIPPRVYKRLYAHLDSALPKVSGAGRSGSGRVRTTGSERRAAEESPLSRPRSMPSRGTPTKGQSLAPFRSMTGPSAGGVAAEKVLPRWVHPVAWFICSETAHRQYAPSVLAGMEAIVASSGRRTQDAWVNENVAGLFASIYFFVVARVRAVQSGETVDREGYIPLRKEILALLKRARDEVIITGREDGNAWEGWTTVRPRDFDYAVAQVNERQWLAADWFKALAEVVSSQQQGRDSDASVIDDEATTQTLVMRADTMFQDRYDYLSEARRAEYRAWKSSMLGEVSRQMDVDADATIETH